MKFHILSLEKVCFTKCLRKHLDFFRFFLYNVYQQKEMKKTIEAIKSMLSKYNNQIPVSRRIDGSDSRDVLRLRS